MKLIHLDILRHGDMVFALAVVVDGPKPMTFRWMGRHGEVTIDEAARITKELIDQLGALEIDTPSPIQVEAFKLAGQPERWVNT